MKKTIGFLLFSLLFIDIAIFTGNRKFAAIFAKNISKNQALLLKEYLQCYAHIYEITSQLEDNMGQMSEDEINEVKDKIDNINETLDAIFNACTEENKDFLNDTHNKRLSFERDQHKTLFKQIIKGLKKRKSNSNN